MIYLNIWIELFYLDSKASDHHISKKINVRVFVYSMYVQSRFGENERIWMVQKTLEAHTTLIFIFDKMFNLQFI